MSSAEVDRWAAGLPSLEGDLGRDGAALRGFVAAGEALLAALPARPDRDEGQRCEADRILAGCRRLRDTFMGRHAERVYDALTAGRTGYRRCPELVHAAAEAFPGLVPTAAQLAAERAHPQAGKDGREIDQGIFFRGLLRSSSAGAHLLDAMLRPTPRATDLLATFRRDGRVDLGTVLVERHAPAAHLTMNNRSCLNAEDDRLIADLETAVDLVLLDDGVRVGVLRGAVMTHPRYAGRRVFSAGINLRDLCAGRITFVDFLLGRELGYLSKVLRGLLRDPADRYPDRTVQKPWVAAVDSFAIGGGMQVLLTFDRVIAADDAFFSLPAAREGIVPGAANLRLGRALGTRLARDVILGGRRIRATDPEAALLCDEVVPGERIGAAVDAAIDLLDNPAVVANRRMLNLADEPPDRFRAYLAEFAVVQVTRLYSPDVLERVARAWSGREERDRVGA